MKQRLAVAAIVIALLAAGAAGPALGGPATARERAFLPLLRAGPAICATLGPSPTPTRSPTAGPTRPPTETPAQTVEALTAGAPAWAGPGEVVAFTVGLVNHLNVPAQVVLRNTLPSGMELLRVFSPVTPTMAGNAFTATLTVAPGRAENIFVFAAARNPCNCPAHNTVSWSATWDGGSASGTALSNPIYLAAATPTATSTPTPTRTPAGPPTLGPSPTPTGGAP